MKFNKTLFLFRRDLRLEDNTGLLFALEHSKAVIPAFIFTPEQIEDNPYLSVRCLQFMLESLEDLRAALQEKGCPLFLFYGSQESIVARCKQELQIDAVIVNRDYTPYSAKRDDAIASVCRQQGIAFHAFEDALLNPPSDTLKANGEPYAIFTPFYRNALKLEVPLPLSNAHVNYYKGGIPFSNPQLLEKILPQRQKQVKGGRRAALELLQRELGNYANMRDYPNQSATSGLSPHLKFTTCSPREIYHSFASKYGHAAEILRSLYWRDFFSSIALYYPHVFRGAFHKEFDLLEWENDNSLFARWCEGKTGFPLVDAGMRELLQTGFMHNRVRMVTASFLVKDLHIDWRWGEKFFAQNLIDYDPAINNGNWQWAASTGCDAQPYFRIFNPWTQGLKFDEDGRYIKKWVPELSSIPSHVIHGLYLPKNKALACSYMPPIIDHAVESKISLNAYQRIRHKKI